MKNELIKNLNKIHTTELGKERIKKNLKIENEPVEYCKEIIKKENSKITLKGKNYYIENKAEIITINKNSYTIITAHKIKKQLTFIKNFHKM